MNASRLIFLMALAGLGATVRLAAAEFDLLANDSYLSPVVVAAARGARAKPPAFAWVAATAAVENNYLSRNDSADIASAVGMVTGDFYADRWQLGGAIEHRSELGNETDPNEDIVPRERYRLYAGYYIPLHKDTSRDRFGGNDFRILGGWNGDQRLGGRWVNEAFVEVAIQLLPERLIARRTFFTDVTGGYLYAWRSDLQKHFFGYSFKATIREKKRGVNLRYLLSFGIERNSGNSHWAEVQNGFVLWYDQPRTKLRYELGVSASRDMYRDKWDSQVMFAIKRDLVTRVIRR